MLKIPTERRRWVARLLLVTSLLLSVVTFEAVLRVMDVYAPAPYPPETTRGNLYQRHDPYGYRLWPSRVATYTFQPRINPRVLTLTSNRHGFRGRRELDELDDRPRIVVLGDSMVFGDGVEETERFTDVLEAIEPQWRIDNMGMTGFGPDLMLMALEKVGLALRPDVVVFCMYTDDFRRVHPQNAGVGFPIPRYMLRSGDLVVIPYPEPYFWHRLRLGVLTRHVYWRFSSAETDLNAAILDRFLEHATEQPGFRPAIVFLPGTEDNAGDQRRRAWLRDYAGRTSTPYLDLTELIHRTTERVFIRGNFHYNAAGHKIVAEELRHFIDRDVLRNQSKDEAAGQPS
jgi:hypothetical protein